jgi:hypothetical protein
MTSQQIRILVTTTVAGQRHAKGDEVSLDERTAWDLVVTGKAEEGKEKQPLKKSVSESSMADKAGGKT